MNSTMSLPVVLTTEEIAIRAKELSETLERRDVAEAEAKFTARSYKQAVEELNTKITSLYRMVNSGKEDREVDVIDKPNYERGLMETFRLDTGDIVKYRQLKESEKTKSLFEEQEAQCDAFMDEAAKAADKLIDIAEKSDAMGSVQ